MNNKERMALILAIAGGAVAGALIASSRSVRPSAQELPPPFPVLALPPPKPVEEIDEHHALVPVAAAVTQRPQITYEMVPWEPPRAARATPWAFTVIAAGLLFFAAAAVTLPRITSMAAPQSVLAGTPATVEYHAGGAGSLSYTIESQGYRRAGPLQARDGTIVVPTSIQLSNHQLFVTVSMHGLLGHVDRKVSIGVLASPKPIVKMRDAEFPRIDGLKLSAPAVKGGGTIVASYRSNAPEGNVRLVDAAGAVWQSVPLVKSGVAKMDVPIVRKDTPFIVVVHAERNTHAIEASAGFVARGIPDVKATSKPIAELAKVPVFKVPPTARSGGLIPIAIPSGLKNVIVTMNNGAGVEMSRTAAVPGESITVEAPNVRSPQPFFIMLNYEAGTEKETLIRRITISP